MGSSLKDQFLKLGLVDKKHVNKAKKEKHQQLKNKKKASEPDESSLIAKAALEQKKVRSKKHNNKKNRERRQKEATAQIRQLIETNLIQMSEGDTPYNFSDNNKIKKIYLSADDVEKLGKGNIAIVKQAGKYQLVPSDIAIKIEELNRKQVVVFHKTKNAIIPTDDPYAEFEVPDDLMW